MLVAALAVFVFSAYKVFGEIWQKQQEQNAFEELSQQIDTSVAQPEEKGKTPEELRLEGYAKLKETNPHFVGWIKIDGTPLDYPVVHTPDNPEYYLRRAFDGSYAISGTPFLGEGCDVNSTNVLIYGHRMNNDTMFTPLLEYADKEFWQEHRQIRFDTVDKMQTYDVVAAFYIEIPQADDADAFRWYNYSGDISGEIYDDYINRVRAHAYYDTETEINNGDKLITLTTCAYNDETQRFVVVARLVQ